MMEKKGESYLRKAVFGIYNEEAGFSATTVSYLEAMSRVEIERGWVRLTGHGNGTGNWT